MQQGSKNERDKEHINYYANKNQIKSNLAMTLPLGQLTLAWGQTLLFTTLCLWSGNVCIFTQNSAVPL